MSWAEAIRLASRSTRRRPGRAALTVMAVTLATALLTAMLTISRTAETRVLDELAEGGPISAIQVAAAEARPGQVDQDQIDAGEPLDLDAGAVEAISAMPDVRAVLPIISAPVFVDLPAEMIEGEPVEPFADRMVGAGLRNPSLLPVTVLDGRLPIPGSLTEVAVSESFLERLDLELTDDETVIGSEIRMAAGRLFEEEVGSDGPDARGRQVVVSRPRLRGRWVRVEIVGVVAQEAAAGQFLVPIEQAERARDWARAGVDGGDQTDDGVSEFSGLVVVARGIDQVAAVRAGIDRLGYATSAPENLVASVRNYLGVVEIVLGSVGAIALAVAALGIANALLAAVRERRREIGVLKAIGARDRDIRRIFVVEAGFLGFVGGVVGTLLGGAIALGVGELVNRFLVEQGLATVRLSLSLPILLGGVIGATVMALVGGVGPAWRAAKLPAREAVGGS